MIFHISRFAIGVGCLIAFMLFVSLLEWLCYLFPTVEKIVCVTIGLLSFAFLFCSVAYIIGHLFF